MPRTFMNMSYGYDAVGNILSLGNSAAIPAGTALYGGTTAYTFGYDNLYQLTSATGAFTKPNVPVQKFTLAMSYDGIHNITHKTQTAFNQLSNGSVTPNLPLTYDSAYAYGGSRPHAASQIGNHTFKYDADGNQAGWNATDSKQNRVIVWDEDDRMQSVTDSSAQPTTFKYDDNTNRVVKKGAGGETLYINPWYVAALGRNSKQIFAGTARIVTKLEQFPTGEGYGTGAKNLTEVYQYFYHPDHLGSTGFATDATGEVYQHLEYFPFGETWVDEVSDDTRVPYRFTGQELDEETKLYYYGARYYDPRSSAWQNAEPALGTFLNAGKPQEELPSLANDWHTNLAGAGMGGMFDPRNLNGFGYVHQNPVRFTDPNGRCIWDGCALEIAVATAFAYFAGTQYANAPGKGDKTYHISDTEILKRTAEGAAAPLVAGEVPQAARTAYRTYRAWRQGQEALNRHNSAAGQLRDLTGKTRAEAEQALKDAGFEHHSTTSGGYTRYRHPDGSDVWIRPNGEIVRTPPRQYAPDGRVSNKGERFGPDGRPTSQHNTGETLKGD